MNYKTISNPIERTTPEQFYMRESNMSNITLKGIFNKKPSIQKT